MFEIHLALEWRHCPNMSTGPETQASFIQGNQSAMEHDASHSALLYLFQEVSKLASPIHNSFLDTNLPSTWLNETSRQGPFVSKKEEDDAHSFQISNGSHQQGLSHKMPCNQMKKVKEKSHSSKVTTFVDPQVLSLIDLQCERLLHHSDVEDSDFSSASSDTKLGHSVDEATDGTDQGVGGDFISVECTLRPSVLVCEREDTPICVSSVEDVRVCSGGTGTPESSVKDCCLQSQAVEKTVAVRPELEEEISASSQPHHRDKRENKFSVHRLFQWNQESKKNCFSPEQDILKAPSSENESLSTQLTFIENEDASVALTKPALTLDHNANLAWTTEFPCDKITASTPECTHAPIVEKFPPISQVKSSSYDGEKNHSPSVPSEPEHRPVEKEKNVLPFTQKWRTKTPRKQPRPSRSADIQDPDFQGVTFRMDTELDDSKEQCRLLITSKYSKELCKSVRKPRPRTRTAQKSLKTSGSEEESDPAASVSKGKVCASCCTRKTPMWRDAEDGTPLCNACGIRYKKYRVRCVNCWHIPRKEGNSNSCCLKCGNFVRLTSALRKHTA
uniref:GATA-type domain-containing protein n=1 Tax=Sparus aurata TaxID=8175 RepID=A0A671TX46_SPAAU